MTTKIEALKNKFGATITAVTVSYDRKMSDHDYGSVGGFMSMTVELGPNGDAPAVAAELFEIVRETAEENLGPMFKAVTGSSGFPQHASTDTQSKGPEIDTRRDSDSPPAYDDTVQSIKFTVEGHDGGKVKLSFFAEGRKWADITRVCTVDTAVSMLQPTAKNGKSWTQNHFEPGKEYPLICTVYYTLSDKNNSAGNPYKDIVAIR